MENSTGTPMSPTDPNGDGIAPLVECIHDHENIDSNHAASDEHGSDEHSSDTEAAETVTDRIRTMEMIGTDAIYSSIVDIKVLFPNSTHRHFICPSLRPRWPQPGCQ